MSNLIKHAFLYIRLAMTSDAGKRLAMQEKRCREFALRNGFTILDTFYDVGVSGNHGFQKRVGGQELLLALETHGNGIAVY